MAVQIIQDAYSELFPVAVFLKLNTVAATPPDASP